MFDITDSGDESRMVEMDLKQIVSRLVLDDEQVTEPVNFAMDSTADAVVVRVHPIPSSNRNLQGEFYVPQDAFVGDSNDLDTAINLPPTALKALETGATWFALEERGEELGTNVNFSEQRYA